MANVHFLTGFPGFLARRLLRRLVERDRKARVWVLAQPRFAKAAKREILGLSPGQASRVKLLVGDVVDMHLGLSGEEYRRLAAEVGRIHHLAAVTELTADRREMEQVNVGGTANVLELGRDAANLVRLGHVSTVQVAGDRRGVIEEDELEEGQRFRNAYEETKYRAEVLVRRTMGELPISIFRPSTIIGDSRPGSSGTRGGPYDLALQWVKASQRLALPFPGDGSFPLNVVPSEFVVDAILELNRKPEAAGKTFHLVDPNPMAARKVFEQVAARAGRGALRPGLPAKASAVLLRLPMLERLLGKPGAAFEHLEQLAIYACRNTLELLDDTEVRCPPLHGYLDRLVSHVEKQAAAERALVQAMEPPVDDPLAPVEVAEERS